MIKKYSYYEYTLPWNLGSSSIKPNSSISPSWSSKRFASSIKTFVNVIFYSWATSCVCIIITPIFVDHDEGNQIKCAQHTSSLQWNQNTSNTKNIIWSPFEN